MQKKLKPPKIPTKKQKNLHPADRYMLDVLDGTIVAGKYVRLACARQLHDLQHGHERGLDWDPQAGQHVIDFFQFCRHSKGKWAGQVIDLAPWQQFRIRTVFGWKWHKTGKRRFRTAYNSVARKSGKSTETAGIGLYGLIADGEQGAEIYTAATKKDQARIIFNEAKSMRDKSPWIKEIVSQVRDNLSYPETNSKFEPLSADRDGLDGLNVHFGLVDELHAHKERTTWDLLETATGSREQSLMWAITTAGSDKTPRSICWEQHKFSTLLLEGFDKPDGVKDDSYFAYIASIDKDDKWDDETTWAKANPNLGISNNIEDLRRKFLKAKESPAAKATFLRLHLNVWTDSVTEWVAVEKWDSCGVDYTAESLKGQVCYGGLDLSSVSDLCSLGLVFPRQEPRMVKNPLWSEGEDESEKTIEQEVNVYRTLAYHWIPQVTAENRTRRDAVMYKTWVEQGWITDTEGDVTDYAALKRDILHLAEMFQIVEISYDRYNSSHLITELTAEELKMVPMGQGFASMNGPTKEMERAMLSGRFEHNRNPVLRWELGNVAIRTNPAGDQKIDKEKSGDKVDGMVALVMGVNSATMSPPPEKSVYGERGLRTM